MGRLLGLEDCDATLSAWLPPPPPPGRLFLMAIPEEEANECALVLADAEDGGEGPSGAVAPTPLLPAPWEGGRGTSLAGGWRGKEAAEENAIPTGGR